MKIRNLLLLFLCFSIFSCNTENQKKETDLERLNLQEKVSTYLKTISRSSNFTIDSEKTDLKEVHREFLSFNRNGNIIEKRNFKKNGELYKKWISIYDKNEYEIGTIEIKYPKDTLKHWVNKYDKSGNEIESLIYDHKDSLLSHTKSTFNDFNEEIESLILKGKELQNTLIKVNYQYDNDGNKIKTTRFYKDKSKTEWFTDYDSIGNETEWRVYDRQGKLERRDTYVYDNNSNLIEEKLYNSENIAETTGISVFDKKGYEIEYTEYLYDSISSKEIYLYDEKGNKTTKYYNSKGELESTIKLTSEFDKQGNITRESSYENGKLKSVKEYKFEYYQ